MLAPSTAGESAAGLAAPLSAEALLPLFVRWPHHPWAFAPGATPQRRAAYALDALFAAQHKGAWTHAEYNEEEAQGAVQLEPLPWDSEILRFSVARISAWVSRPAPDAARLRATLLERALSQAALRGVDYLLARVDAADFEGAQLLEGYGFRLVDALLSFGGSCADETRPRNDPVPRVHCRPFRPEDLPALEDIAASSFSLDRFHADPVIGGQRADAVHRRWIADSCAGFADAVLVARDAVAGSRGGPLGFTTLKVDARAQKHFGHGTGVIVLVATSAAHRGRGVAAALTRAALEWFRARGCAWVEVGTQLSNLRASRVYQNAGFRLAGSAFTFRRVLRNAPLPKGDEA